MYSASLHNGGWAFNALLPTCQAQPLWYAFRVFRSTMLDDGMHCQGDGPYGGQLSHVPTDNE
jgi:hypothetical protein